MCGIFGFYSFQKEGSCVVESRLETMKGLLKHRGPDDDGYYFNDHVGVGNTRLAILGIKDGHQPMFSDDGQIVVVQNGEIYNYVELQQEVGKCITECDTEIIIRLYEKYGARFVSKLNGMFAIALYDKKIDTLFLYRDRVGVKPLYVYNNGNTIFFSSEIKPILSTNQKFKISHEALDSLLTFNYVLPPNTLYKGIEHLKPGYYCSISCKAQKAEFHQWWSLSDIKLEKSLKESDIIPLLQSTLESAVQLRLRSDVPCGAFLSGGLDSTSIVGYMRQLTSGPIDTFSIGFAEKIFDESFYAKQASDRFHTTHHLEIQSYSNFIDDWRDVIYHCEQPHGDVSFIPTLSVSRLAHRNNIKVILTGDGGDELFAGYDKYLTLTDRQHFLANFFVFDVNAKKNLYKKSGVDKNYQNFINFHLKQFEHQDDINRFLAFDTLYLLSGNNLVKPDRMGLSVGLETRTPFLDYRMIELAFRIPGYLKLQQGVTKYIYKKSVENLIGKELTYRKKQMFTVPIGDWFRTSLSSFIFSILHSKESILNELFEKKHIEKMLAMHINMKKNYTRELRLLVAIHLWWELFGQYCDL